jgi:hypothetical protein
MHSDNPPILDQRCCNPSSTPNNNQTRDSQQTRAGTDAAHHSTMSSSSLIHRCIPLPWAPEARQFFKHARQTTHRGRAAPCPRACAGGQLHVPDSTRTCRDTSLPPARMPWRQRGGEEGRAGELATTEGQQEQQQQPSREEKRRAVDEHASRHDATRTHTTAATVIAPFSALAQARRCGPVWPWRWLLFGLCAVWALRAASRISKD